MAEKKNEVAVSKAEKPSKGRGGARNFPNAKAVVETEEDRALVIKKAKYFCKTFDAKMVISGKLNFLAYCFRAKNYYGMVDKQEVVLTPNQNPEEYSVEDIRQQYMLGDSATLGESETETNDFAEGSSDF